MKSWTELQPDEYMILATHFTRGRDGKNINKVVVHYNAGDLSISGCYNVWQDRPASAHYQVDSNGRIGQLVNDWDTAWHAGNWDANTTSIGIEHANKAGGYITDAALDNGAHLTAAICKYYGLGRPQWLTNVFPHQYFQATSCPGQIYGAQKDAFMSRAQEWYDSMTGSKPAPSEPVQNPVNPTNKGIYCVFQCYDRTHGWLPEVDDYFDGTTSDYAGWLGYPITGLRAKTPGKQEYVGNLEYRLHALGGGWFNWRRDYDTDSTGDTFAGNLSAACDGLQMTLKNCPGHKVRYRVHIVGGGWLPWVTEYGSGNDGYAGIWGNSIDGVQIDVQ